MGIPEDRSEPTAAAKRRARHAQHLRRRRRELVAITSNNVAYLKRPIEELVVSSEYSRDAPTPAKDWHTNGNDEREGRIQEVKAKYRDPTTNETWSGRGRMANWLKRKQEAGEDIHKYLV